MFSIGRADVYKVYRKVGLTEVYVGERGTYQAAYNLASQYSDAVIYLNGVRQ
jgi:hypothetical protein